MRSKCCCMVDIKHSREKRSAEMSFGGVQEAYAKETKLSFSHLPVTASTAWCLRCQTRANSGECGLSRTFGRLVLFGTTASTREAQPEAYARLQSATMRPRW